MKNILEFNDFKQHKNSNLITEAAGTDDKYFENVKGNLAGAENTLIGSAVLKLFGFIKRKGMEVYLSGVLKQRLGKQYFNNILRYIVKDTSIVRPSEKKLFEVKAIQEGNKATGDVIRVQLKQGETVGIYAFVVGANVSKEDGAILEDGKYSFLYYVGSTFSCEGGLITKLDTGLSTPQPEADEITENVQQEETKETEETHGTQDEFKEENEEIAEETQAEQDVIDDCNKIRKMINDEVEKGTFTSKKKQVYIHQIQTQLDELKRLGIGEIDKALESDELSKNQREEIERDRKVYSANILELYKLINDISKVAVSKEVQVQSQVQVQTEGQVSLLSYANKLFEETNDVIKTKNVSRNTTSQKKIKTGKAGDEGYINKASNFLINKDIVATKTNKASDELQEISGKLLDFNDPTFYKQFEKEGMKEKVTNVILDNKSDIVKIQIQAERIIGDSPKMKNAWERMVQDVLGKYSKFMLVDKVNPIQLKGNTTAVDDDKKGKETEAEKGRDDGDKVEMSNALENIKVFKNIATKVVEPSMKELKNKDVGLFYATINGTNALWVYEYNQLNIGSKLTRKAYRILGYITNENQNKLKSNPEAITSIKEYISTNFYGMFVNDVDSIKTSENDLPLKGLYIFGKSTNFSFSTNNSATIGLLYYGDNFDTDKLNSYAIKLLDRDKKGKPYELKQEPMPRGTGRRFQIEVKAANAACSWKVEASKSSEFIEYSQHEMNSINDTINKSLNSVVEIKSNKE